MSAMLMKNGLFDHSGLTWSIDGVPPQWKKYGLSLTSQANMLGLTGIGGRHHDAAGEPTFKLCVPGLTTIETRISLNEGRIPLSLLSEQALQAVSGLMSVHGRSSGRLVPLGVDYLSVMTAGMTLQAALAVALGQMNGGDLFRVGISPIGCAMLSIGQYLAGATVREDRESFSPGQYDSMLRPPFVSADGVIFELETLDSGPWRRFWEGIGLTAEQADRGWRVFLLRYARAVSPLPDEYMTCIGRLQFQKILEKAKASGISVVPVRHVTDRRSDIDYQYATDLWKFNTRPASGSVRPRHVPTGLPLRGLRVIESCRRIQGPLAGHLLAMLGADVIRIEPPGGDLLRAMPPCADGCSVRFDALNHLKAVREIDIKTSFGRKEVLEMVRESDVFLHNWAPGKAETMKLDHHHLHDIQPDLVYAQAGGWGAAHVDAPGTDFTVQAWSGVAKAISSTSGTRGGSLFTVLDVLGGVMCSVGISASLLHRSVRGGGVYVMSSLMDTADHLMQITASDSFKGYGLHGVFDTRKGAISIECTTAEQVRELARCLGGTFDRSNVVADRQKVECKLLSRTALEWESILTRKGIAAFEVTEDISDLAKDIQMRTHLITNAYSAVQSPWRFQ